MRALRSFVGLTLMGASLVACKGLPLTMSEPPRPNETVIAEVEGSSTGLMLFQVIPIGQNPRFQVAYDRAMAKAPGATRLANATISENWFWAYIMNGYTTTIRGIAVK